MSELKKLVFEALDNARNNEPEILKLANCKIADELQNLTSGFEGYKIIDISSCVNLYKIEIRNK